jgi:hypothetical protein
MEASQRSRFKVSAIFGRRNNGIHLIDSEALILKTERNYLLRLLQPPWSQPRGSSSVRCLYNSFGPRPLATAQRCGSLKHPARLSWLYYFGAWVALKRLSRGELPSLSEPLEDRRVGLQTLARIVEAGHINFAISITAAPSTPT